MATPSVSAVVLGLAIAASPPAEIGRSTAGDAVLVHDHKPGPGHGFPRVLRAVGDRLLFAVDEDGHPQLWTTDGSTSGTRRLYDETIHSASRVLVPDGERAFLWLWGPGPEVQPGVPETALGLWYSDGTPEGTARVTEGVGFDVMGSF